MLARYGVRVHKIHNGPYGEIGMADLVFVLPDGRCGWVETKRPGASVTSPRALNQLRWLAREIEAGAFGAMVSSWEELDGLLKDAGY